MKQILLLCGMIISVFNYAQSEGPVLIDKLKDKASDLNFFKVAIPIWDINLNDYNMSIYDLSITPHIQLGDKFYITANYTYSLGDRLSPEVNESNDVTTNTFRAVSIYEHTRANSFSLDGSFFFKQDLQTKDVRIKLKSHRSGNTTYETVTYVPGEILTRYGLRLGFTKGITWYAFDDNTITGIDKSGNSQELDYQQKSSMLDYSNLRIGLCRAIQTNLHVNAKGYGYRTNAGFDYVYADVVLSLKNKFDDVYGAYLYESNSNKMYYRQYEIDYNLKKSKLGFAIGFRSLPFIGLGSFDIEAGAFPGVKKEGNGYLKIGFNLAFGTSEKMKDEKKKSDEMKNAPKN